MQLCVHFFLTDTHCRYDCCFQGKLNAASWVSALKAAWIIDLTLFDLPDWTA